MTNFSTYQEVLEYLYTQLPMFQRVGGTAFRKDLVNTEALCDFLEHPQHRFKSIHVAGTNGKGSSSHMIASVLQEAGYKTGLYTSPHLKDFTERVKINGEPVAEHFVVSFINRILPVIETLSPSFFEITVALAFNYFAQQQVDIAIIEVGMGGRLDSTNVIQPELSLITNISEDHKQWLGDTLEKIAFEKAGIIKDHTPVVISEKQPEITHVFDQKATDLNASLSYASDEYSVSTQNDKWSVRLDQQIYLEIEPGLVGDYQCYNLPGVLKAIELVAKRGFRIEKKHIERGLEHVVSNTGIKGRWQVLGENPFMVCDVAHNVAGVKSIMDQVKKKLHGELHIIWGMVDDKEIDDILRLLPTTAYYYFCQAGIPRAKKARELQKEASHHQLQGTVIENVNLAIQEALSVAKTNDLIFIGGSNFIVAEIDSL